MKPTKQLIMDLRKEFLDLTAKANALSFALATLPLPADQLELMHQQAEAMEAYANTLLARVELLTKVVK